MRRLNQSGFLWGICDGSARLVFRRCAFAECPKQVVRGSPDPAPAMTAGLPRLIAEMFSEVTGPNCHAISAVPNCATARSSCSASLSDPRLLLHLWRRETDALGVQRAVVFGE